MKRMISVAVLVMVITMSWYAASETELNLFNGSFERLASGVHVAEALGRVPLGWAVSPPKDATAWRIGLTDEKSFEGSLSIKVEVEQKQGGILVSSAPIEVEPGRTYAALANVYNVEDPALDRYPIQLYLQFWSEDGWWGDTDYWSEASWAEQSLGRWGTARRLGSKWILSTKFEEWEEVILVADAPPGAKYVTVDIWTANRSMTAYVDGIRLAVLD